MSKTKARAKRTAVQLAALMAWIDARQASVTAQRVEVVARERLMAADSSSRVPKPGHFNGSV